MKKGFALVLTLVLTLCAVGALAASNPFTVTDTSGTAGTDGTDYEWSDSGNLLTIMKSGLTISMASGNSTSARIEIASNVTSVTLAGVKISAATGPAIEQLGTGTLTVTLEGDNVLETTADDYAALQQGSVTITKKRTAAIRRVEAI